MSPDRANPDERPLTDRDFQALARFRTGLRRFLAFSERAARDEGITPAHHQLLLAIRGHRGGGPPSISDLAEALQRRRHSIVELVDRAEAHGLVTSEHDPDDLRRRLITLTPEATTIIERLSASHRRELQSARADLNQILDDLA